MTDTQANITISEINNNVVNKYNKSKTKNRLIICFICFCLLLISFIRLPYTGCFIDAIFFDYLFGSAKYFAYGYLLTLIIFKAFNKSIKQIFFNNKVWLFGLLLLLVILLLTSSISWLCGNHTNQGITQNFTDPLIKYHSFFSDYLNNKGFKTWFKMFLNPNITGGIIGEFFVALSFVMQWGTLFIFVIILLVIAFLILLGVKNLRLLNKVKKSIVHALGGTFKEEISEEQELNSKNKDKKINILDPDLIQKEAASSSSQTPPLSFLTDTSVNNDLKNEEKLEKDKRLLEKFFNEKGIDIEFHSSKLMPLYGELIYKFKNDVEVSKLLHTKDQLLNLLKVEKINIFAKGNLITIEIVNILPSKVSVKNVLTSYNDLSANNSCIGQTYNSKLLVYDFVTSPAMFIIGKPGSGAIMQASSTICSHLYLNTPSNLKLLLCSPCEEKIFEDFSGLEHLYSYPIESAIEATTKLQSIIEEIDKRINLFDKDHSINLNQYNTKNPTQQFPFILVCIFNLDKYLEASPNNSPIVEKLVSHDAKKAGIRTILYTKTIDDFLMNEQINKGIDCFFIFQTADEITSKIFLNSSRAVKLNGKGDGYMLNRKDHSKVRIQSCYINKEELSETFKIINTFYQYKNK